MIINDAAYKELYPALEVENLLVNTWFLCDENVCYFDLPNITPESPRVPELKKLIFNVKKAAEPYHVFDIFEASTAFRRVPAKKIFSWRPQEFTYLYKQVVEYPTKNWEGLGNALHDEPPERLLAVSIGATYEALVMTEDGVQERELQNSMRLDVHFAQDAGSGLPDYFCRLYISMNSWSLMRQNNDLGVFMIYILNHRFLEQKEDLNPEELIAHHLAVPHKVREMSAKARHTPRLLGNQDKYDYYRNCVLVVPDSDDYFLPLSGNQHLAGPNKRKFLKFMKNLEKTTGSKVHWKVKL